MKKLYYLMIIVVMSACKEEVKKQEPIDNSIYSTEPNYKRPNLDNQAYGNLEKHDEYNIKANSKLLQMAIDSTYSAMNQIEKIKDDINGLQATSFSTQERNYRSKSLMQLNLIQNTLCRQIDSALLVNLKTHTSQLVIINKKIAENSEHLQRLNENLQKAATILDRISGILGTCLSKGIVRPAIPR